MTQLKLYMGFAEVLSVAGARQELKAWLALAVTSLAVAGVFAIMLAISRLPVVEDPVDFFHKGLVIHVIFSFVIWFLAVFGALLHLATLKIAAGNPRFNVLGKIALMMAATACILLFIPAFLARSEASLNNYVPIIIDPVYYLGLTLLATAMTMAVLRLLFNLPKRQKPLNAICFAIVCSGIIYLLALTCGLIALWHLRGVDASHAFNEDLFWGSGHVLQFINVSLLLSAWYMLGRLTLNNGGMNDGLYRLIAALMLLLALPAPIFYMVFDIFSADQMMAFTNLQYAFAVPTMLTAGVLFVSVIKHRFETLLPWQEPAFLALILSPMVFGVGGVLGLFVDGADTRTPAHYHGVIDGINLAFMGLFYALFLPLLGQTVKYGKALRMQFYMFGGGQLFASTGLFLAGGYGVPRKTAGAGQGLEQMGAIIGMYMNGVGALIAVIGGVMFIWTVAKALIRVRID